MNTSDDDTREAARQMRAAGLSSAQVREELARLRAEREQAPKHVAA